MENLGTIDADPNEPPNNEEVIHLANRLLAEFNIPTTIQDVGDICAALFVLLYENLFSDRLSGIIRHPVSKEDEIYNCQTVIDVLSTDIVRDSLSHIRGVDIVEGDITAISNLLDIFSYLLEYVANRIESDVGTDNEDGKSLTTAEHDSHLKEKDSNSNQHQTTQHPRETTSLSNRSGEKKSNFYQEKNARRSPGINSNDNNSGAVNHDIFNNISRQRVPSPSKLDVDTDDLDIPPSPIRPDNSQSLLGQKTVDSTELDSQFGKEERESKGRSPIPKVAWDDKQDLNDKLCELRLRGDPTTDVGHPSSTATSGAISSTKPSAPSASNGLSATVPPTKQTHIHGEDQDVPFRSTIGPIDYFTPRTQDEVQSRRNYDPATVKGLSSSYNDLRHLVERTAAMTRVALQTSPIMGKVERDLKLADTLDYPRPTIPSDGARLARELNAQEMRRTEPRTSPNKATKKVAFSSYTNGISDRSYRHRYPLEELSDNDYTKDSSNNKKKSGLVQTEYFSYGNAEENFISRARKPSPELRKRTKKSPCKSEAFANHLAQSRQPELGAAHLKLKTEDRAIKKKQDFLQRLYQDDLGEFSEDVRALLDKDYTSSREKEKGMLKTYQESKPLVNGTKKIRNPSKTETSKKPKLGSRSASAKRSNSVPRSTSNTTAAPLKLESEEDLLPFLLEEFPHLHLSGHTWHELCRKGLHQIEAITRVYQENKRKKSRAQIQLEEAAQRHEILSDIMRKELDHTKRLRELKEQKTKQIQMKNKTHEKRVQSARARRYYNEYQVRARSKQLKRRTRQEMVFRDLFKDAIKIQKERIKDIRQYASDQRKCQETRRQNEMESIENYYHDQFNMLAEKVTQDRKDTILRDKAQQQLTERMKQELRKKIESEICLYQEQMFRDDDDTHFRQMDADRVRRQLHTARYAAQI